MKSVVLIFFTNDLVKLTRYRIFYKVSCDFMIKLIQLTALIEFTLKGEKMKKASSLHAGIIFIFFIGVAIMTTVKRNFPYLTIVWHLLCMNVFVIAILFLSCLTLIKFNLKSFDFDKSRTISF